MSKRTGYLVLCRCLWEDLALRSPLAQPLELDKSALPGVGYLPIFDTAQEATDAFPDTPLMPFTYEGATQALPFAPPATRPKR